MVRTRCYREGRLVAEGFPVAEVSDRLAEPAATLWFDLHTPDREDLDTIREELGLHALAVEDGVPFLLHGLLDYVVDTHYESIQRLDTAIDALEDDLFAERPRSTVLQRGIFELRKSLVNLRRLTLPMREIVNTLMRRDLKIVDGPMGPYFQDVYDHVLRVTEWADDLRDLLGNILETRLVVRSNRLNVIMKQVTSWAAIIAVPTAVTGFYGQNVPYPGFAQSWGFWVSTAVIGVASLLLYRVFKRKEWL